MSPTHSTATQSPVLPTHLEKAQDTRLGAPDSDCEDDSSKESLSDIDDTTAYHGAWTQYKEQMQRLTTAVERAVALKETGANLESTSKNGKIESHAIVVEFSQSQSYRIPWDACRTWPRMKVFLQEWFSQDEGALQAINDSCFTLADRYDGTVSTALWESVVEPDTHLIFSLQPPSDVTPPPPPPIVGDDAIPETLYENRVQYKVSYYRRHEFGGRAEFVSESVYTEPVDFEVTNEHAKFPVLEESKRIESPPEATRNEGLAFGNTRVPLNGKLPKLRQDDIVSEPILKVHSPFLLNILKAVIECSAEPPAGDREGLDAGIFVYPFKDLYLHLDDLLEYKTSNSELRLRHSDAFNNFADQHIDLLKDYLESHPSIQYQKAKARWTENIPSTTFGTFWLLMKPGTDVYVRETDGSLNRYVLDRLNGGTFRDSSDRKITAKYTAQVWNLVLDGKAIRQYTRHIDIQVFDDERQITELPVFPVKYNDQVDGGAIHRNLIARGKKYFTYSKRPCFLQYNGQGLKPGSRSYKRARVVVEHASRPWSNGGIWGTDLSHHMPEHGVPETVLPIRSTLPGGFMTPPPPPMPPGNFASIVGESLRVARCECKDCLALAGSKDTYFRLKFSDYRDINPRRAPGLTNHQYSILPSHMFAFILNEREYDLLEVSTLEEPSMAETAIDRLVMPAPLKELIKAVAKTYTDTIGHFSADFIQGKGEGQIILLHGPPGTGKTLTAESVAEYTRRPLLSITAADLGHEPETLEKSLLQYFRRANDWDAIVLLDEADVYLEKRSASDLERNSIVSVFLRALEYFQGILFLTTNRVAQFDEAFMSRIHLSLGYDKLSDDARIQIWGNLFQKLKDDHRSGGPKIEYDYDAKRYVEKDEDVKALQWNGREIRNAFQTAVALAVYDSKAKSKNGVPAVPEVTEDHLKQVVSMSTAFRRYITAAHEGMDDSERAFKHGNRDDSVTSAPKW